MSKQNPNQNFYKTGGRTHSDGPDRGDALGKIVDQDRKQFEQIDKNAHPADKRSAKKK